MKRRRQSLQKPARSHWLHSAQGRGRAPSQRRQDADVEAGLAATGRSGGIGSIY
jgi:hypothetical protein